MDHPRNGEYHRTFENGVPGILQDWAQPILSLAKNMLCHDFNHIELPIDGALPRFSCFHTFQPHYNVVKPCKANVRNEKRSPGGPGLGGLWPRSTFFETQRPGQRPQPRRAGVGEMFGDFAAFGARLHDFGWERLCDFSAGGGENMVSTSFER